ncbi:Hypothetical protein I5071_33540 [Sandaracinus amylolyticus]|nr:Hypothetical protein I5071_33540 [Sandaracinus amylolyticus]
MTDEPRPSPDLPGFRWSDVVVPLVEQHGGWTALANALVQRSTGLGDALTVEKGLRRLARRGHREGGRYGRWVLRAFGAPAEIEAWARWLAQWHSRFTDLPSSIRLEQLRLWDRPPISESRIAAWIHTGIASAHFTRGELDECLRRLAIARAIAARHDLDADIEIALFEGRLAGDSGEHERARARIDDAEASLARREIGRADRLAYRARIAGQRAFLRLRPPDGERRDVEAARALYESLEDAHDVPFAACARANGIAYCAFEMGDRALAVRAARRAAEHAADGGLVRFRLMALSFLSRVVEPDEAAEIIARTRRMAKMLDDDELVRRTEHDALRRARR